MKLVSAWVYIAEECVMMPDASRRSRVPKLNLKSLTIA